MPKFGHGELHYFYLDNDTICLVIYSKYLYIKQFTYLISVRPFIAPNLEYGKRLTSDVFLVDLEFLVKL